MLWRLLGVLVIVTLTSAAGAYFARGLFPGAWARWAKRAFVVAYAAGAASIVLWRAGRSLDVDLAARVGATVVGAVLASSVAVFLSSIVWAPLGALAQRRAARAPASHGVVRRTAGTRSSAGAGPGAARTDAAPDPGRRAFLGRVAGALPITAAATGPVGAAAASLAPVVRQIEAKSATVPRALDGLKILQLTDVHLGTFIDVDQVQRAVDAARPHAPDLIVLTGDIADDYALLPAALAAVRALAPRLGTYACIGNHEIYRGRAQAQRLFADAGVTFLCDDGVVIEHGGARLWLCGADDPARLGREHRPFLEGTIGRALAGCPDDILCRIVLSHRPEGFEAAARRGATLTLSGHTHGAQMALFGRSLLEWLLPDSYLLGTYRRGASVLYTSAGLGHWFPFRLNCPCEVAVITLRSA